MDKAFFRLFASCVPVKGAARSIICDTQRGQYRFIPNELYAILTEKSDRAIAAIIEEYGEENRTVIEAYFDFLEKEELGFRCDADELALFPPVNWRYDHPSLIHHAIIDVDAQSHHDYPSLLAQLEALGCKHLQLRIYQPRPLSYCTGILSLLATSRIISVEIILPFTEATTEAQLSQLVAQHPRIQGFVVHSAPFNKVAVLAADGMGHIIYSRQSITNHTHCGVVQPGYFSVNGDAFAEARHFNSCLHRKISIDVAGYIRNCPSMTTDYGHASVQPLHEVVQRDDFRKSWAITKDLVSTCRDCEFRYICTDCRAFVQDKEDPLSKPAKCNYDPYTAQWK